MTQGMASNAGLRGPASATDNAIARYDGTTGRVVQNSAVTIDDATGLMNGYAFENHIATLASNDVSGSDIGEKGEASFVVTLAGVYLITAQAIGYCVGGTGTIQLFIKTGNPAYASATARARTQLGAVTSAYASLPVSVSVIITLSAGDTVHLGVSVTGASGNRVVLGTTDAKAATSIMAVKIG